jgi:hypothetical protein
MLREVRHGGSFESPNWTGAHRLLALRAGRAYDKNLPFLEVFQSSKGEVMIAMRKCG